MNTKPLYPNRQPPVFREMWKKVLYIRDNAPIHTFEKAMTKLEPHKHDSFFPELEGVAT